MLKGKSKFVKPNPHTGTSDSLKKLDSLMDFISFILHAINFYAYGYLKDELTRNRKLMVSYLLACTPGLFY